MTFRRAHIVLFSIATLSATVPGMAFAASVGGLARGLGTSVQRVVEGQYALAPFASVLFCVKNKDQCADSGGEEIVTLTENRRAELQSVNSGINRAIRPQNDLPSQDEWSVDVKAGDCEDYALTKKKHLLALGWSSRALRIAVATTRYGEGHAVLIVKTSEGDLVLDNRISEIRDWTRTDLYWIKMQTASAKTWTTMERRQRDLVVVSASRQTVNKPVVRKSPVVADRPVVAKPRVFANLRGTPNSMRPIIPQPQVYPDSFDIAEQGPIGLRP